MLRMGPARPAASVSATPKAAKRTAPLVFVVWAAVALGAVWVAAPGGGFGGIYDPEPRLVSVWLG